MSKNGHAKYDTIEKNGHAKYNTMETYATNFWRQHHDGFLPAKRYNL